MGYLPVILKTDGKRCLVVGGGEVATRKVERLLRAGLSVTVVAPDIAEAIRYQASHGRLGIREKVFEPTDLEAADFCFVAVDDHEASCAVVNVCRGRKIPVNVADQPALCDFTMPSIVDRGPVQVAIHSSGSAPVLARHLRERIELMLPSATGELAAWAKNIRGKMQQALPDAQLRRRAWEQVLDGSIARMVESGRRQDAEQALDRLLAEQKNFVGGEVWLIGAGPGDPDLLTLRALRLMQAADIVLYDRLVSQPVLDLVRRDAEKIYVGKERDRHTLPQDQINQKLIELARQGHRVLRLKGGDPFIFGRGGEEIEDLAASGIPFQVVPGITAASGCASYAGIPLTHRDHAQACVMVTGHPKKGSGLEMNWAGLARQDQTVVIYMGLTAVERICQQFQAQGLPADWPAAAVVNGTCPDQQVVIGDLATLPERVRDLPPGLPCLIIVGSVVTLHDHYSWFTGAESQQPNWSDR